MAMLWVFVGGGCGSLVRYLLAQQFNQSSKFLPFGTLAANIISCFILGLLYHQLQKGKVQEMNRHLLMIGFCGGFSTFSTYGLEVFQFFQKGLSLQGFVYLFLSNIACIVAIMAGYYVGNKAEQLY